MAVRGIVTILATGGTIACTDVHAAKPAPVTPSATPQPTPSATISDLAGVFISKRFAATLPLPGPGTWQIDDTRTLWLSAKQPATQSTLLMRTWFDENRMSRQRCEERARSFRRLPTREGGVLLDQRSINVPTSFDTVVDVLVQDEVGSTELYGLLLAFGGNARRCFAYVYVTRDAGPGSRARIADRLVQMLERSLIPLRFRNDLQPAPERPSHWRGIESIEKVGRSDPPNPSLGHRFGDAEPRSNFLHGGGHFESRQRATE